MPVSGWQEACSKSADGLYNTSMNKNNVEYFENLDFRKAVIKNHQVFLDDLCLSELSRMQKS